MSGFFVYCYADHRDLHVLTHSFPSRRSSDLLKDKIVIVYGIGPGLGVKLAIEAAREGAKGVVVRSEEHTSELQSLMRTSYAVFCLKQQMTTEGITTMTGLADRPVIQKHHI